MINAVLATLVVKHLTTQAVTKTHFRSYRAAEAAAQSARSNPNVMAVAFRPERQSAANAFFNALCTEA